MLTRARDEALKNIQINFLPWDSIGAALGGALDALTGQDKAKQEAAAEKARLEEQARLASLEKQNVSAEKNNNTLLIIGGGIVAAGLLILFLKR